MRYIHTILSKNDTQIHTRMSEFIPSFWPKRQVHTQFQINRSKSRPNFRPKSQNLYPISDQQIKIYIQFQTKMPKFIVKFNLN